MKLRLQTLFFFLLVMQIGFGQTNDNLPIRLPHTTHSPGLSPLSLHPSFYDRKAEWQWIIDSTWGPGEPLSDKLTTFDTYQDFVRAYNATFLWNPTNWDSLVAILRSKINDSTSRGGFQRILNDLVEGIRDGHGHAYNNTVINTPLNPGIPLLIDGSGYINHFGAGLTPLVDSSLLVYKVVPNHPLGLEPGDIILGYQGVPWHQIVHELLDGNVPYTILRAVAPSAYRRYLLESAGESWHLFDTIDVVKHSTGLTEHMPLDPMVNLVAPNYIINNEQMPVPGVPMPLGFFSTHGAVTYGIIDGTNIGYIYVYHHVYAGVSSEFDAAVQALMQTDGLIIDIRVDWGGGYGLNTGISRLINFQTYTLDMMKRCDPGNLFEICPSNVWFVGEIPDDIGTYYDRPIAVLIGSGCVSYGDISSWQLKYVPYARMFGRPPAAAYSGMVLYNQPTRPGYSLQCPDVTLVDHYSPSEPRWGQEYPNFEEVWLTPDGVANGEDDVVIRALEWMNNVVYPHNTLTDRGYYNPTQDTVNLSTIIENSNSHQLSARAYFINSSGVLIDSVNLIKQTLHPESEYWFADFSPAQQEDIYYSRIAVFDETALDQFTVPNATRFTTAGPIKIDSLIISYNPMPRTYKVVPLVRNLGQSFTVDKLSITISSDDSTILYSIGTVLIDSLQPGEVVLPTSGYYTVKVDSNFSLPFIFNFAIRSDGWLYWRDTISIVTSVEGEEILPEDFVLYQNYPNPFNPSTTFRYSIPQTSKVVLKVFDILGNEIATLVDEYRSAGKYEVEFSASKLPSGVYFYQLKAGEYVNTKKMILLK